MDDVEAIKQLGSRYNLAFDYGDLDGYLATWTEDGYFERTHGAGDVFRYRGREELRGVLTGNEVDGRHLTTNFVIEVSGDRATQSAYLAYLERGADFTVTMFGVYGDELLRTEDGWKFATRRLRIDD